VGGVFFFLFLSYFWLVVGLWGVCWGVFSGCVFFSIVGVVGFCIWGLLGRSFGGTVFGLGGGFSGWFFFSRVGGFGFWWSYGLCLFSRVGFGLV